MGPAPAQHRCPFARALSARHLDRGLPGGAGRDPAEGCAEPVAECGLADEARVAGIAPEFSVSMGMFQRFDRVGSMDWGLAFLRQCTRVSHARNTVRLRRLSLHSRNMLTLAEDAMGLPTETRHDGGLYVFQDKDRFDTYRLRFPAPFKALVQGSNDAFSR